MTRSVAAALRDLPIDFPAPPDLEPILDGLRPVPGRRRRRRLRWAIAAGAASVIVAGAAVAPMREAVADWLGIGAVRIERVATLPSQPGEELDLGIRIDAADSGIEVAGVLGEPAAAYLRAGDVSVVWLPGPDLPEVGSTGVGALLTRFDGSLDEPSVAKAIGPDAEISLIEVDGGAAYWIEGEAHTFGYIAPDGELLLETIRLAGSTLLWEGDGYTWRLESALARDDAVGVAEALSR